jgi:putative NADPH-quinone reductase
VHISLILAHPDSRSFNHAIARTAQEALIAGGHVVYFHDLCTEGFDPLLPTCQTKSSSIARKLPMQMGSSSSIPIGGDSRPPF